MEKLITNKPLLAKAIYFKNGYQTIHNCLVWIAGNFVVIARDESDNAPTWYNTNIIERMEGVEQIREAPQTRIEQRMAFF